MWQILKYACIFFSLSVVIIIIAIYYSDEIVHWESLSSNESPNKELIASAYSYGSDGDSHAPYGQYVFLNRSWNLSKSTEGHVIFAGYCKNTPSLIWLSNTDLSIKCKLSQGEKVRTLSNRAYGVSIKFEQE